MAGQNRVAASSDVRAGAPLPWEKILGLVMLKFGHHRVIMTAEEIDALTGGERQYQLAATVVDGTLAVALIADDPPPPCPGYVGYGEAQDKCEQPGCDKRRDEHPAKVEG